MKINVLIYVLVLLTVSGCASLNSGQTGRTLGKDKFEVIGNTSSLSLVEIGLQKGVRENLDLGMRVSLDTHVKFISKFQFLGNKKSLFASSLGVDVGVIPLLLINKDFTFSSTISIYNSIFVNDDMSITLTPRATIFEDLYSEGFVGLGYTTGLSVGSKIKFFVNLTMYPWISHDYFDGFGYYHFYNFDEISLGIRIPLAN